MNNNTILFRLSPIAAVLLVAAQPAYAQCIPAAPDPGPGADTISCVSSNMNPDTGGGDVYGAGGTNGIVFTSSGDLTVNLTGALATNLGSGGVSLTAGGIDDDISFARTGGAIGGSQTNNTAPVIVDLQSQNGDVIFNTTGSISGNAANVEYGVRAQSAGSGDVSITATGSISTGTGATNPGIAGILATSNGGDVTINQDFTTANPTVTGRQYGIQASTTGTGNLSILAVPREGGTNPGGNMVAVTAATAVAGIDASVQSGNLRIDVAGGGINTNASSGTAIRASIGSGDAAINVRDGTTQGATVFDLAMGGGTAAIRVEGYSDLRTPSVGANSAQTGRLMLASGTGDLSLDNVNGRLNGRFELQGFAGDFNFTNAMAGNGWLVTGLNRFSQGDVTITNTGAMTVSATPGVYVRTTTLDFGATGTNQFSNAGLLVIGRNSQNNNSYVGGNLELVNLDRFDNSGLIIMGSPQLANSQGGGGAVMGISVSDGYYDDVMVMRNGHYHGDDGRIWIDALLNNVGQSSCARNGEGLEGVTVLAANATAGHMRANDCLDFRGSSVTGRTGVIVTDVLPGDRGAYNPAGNVVVDVAGADPAEIDPEAFFIAPENEGYIAAGGGVIDKGLFVYAMGYDEDSQSFRLYGVESQSSIQLAQIGNAANDLWRSTVAPWAARQAAIREEGATPASGISTWLRGAAQSVDRKLENKVAAGANILNFDNSFTQNNSSLTFGIDYGRAVEGTGYWNVGFMAGYARSRIGYDASPNRPNMEGVHAGVYGSFTAGRFFHTFALNGSWVDLENDVPSLGLVPEGTILGADVASFGGQLETGWTFRIARLDVEPLVNLSWVQSKFDELVVPADDPVRLGGIVSYDDPKSFRAGVGVRLAMKDVVPSFLPVDVSLTAKTARESDGVARISVQNVGPTDAVISDKLDGTFNQVTGVVTISNRAGTIAGYLNVDAVMASDYDSLGASAGFRLMW